MTATSSIYPIVCIDCIYGQFKRPFSCEISSFQAQLMAKPQGMPVGRHATNADCRLADRQVNEENLDVKCFKRGPYLYSLRHLKV